MEFTVRRASNWGRDTEPVESAYRRDAIRLDRIAAPHLHHKYQGKEHLWREKGTNHRVDEYGWHIRNIAERAWFVKFGNLDELMAFVKEHGKIVIQKDHNYDSETMILIYDDCIE